MAARRSPPAAPARPIIEVLDRPSCERFLRKQHVGRIAYTFRNRVDIEPLHYVYSKGKIYGRTSVGTKISTIAHSHWVAFEVDDVREMFTWESVVVHGTFHILSDEGSDIDKAVWRGARAALKRLLPDSWTPRDPVPHRTILFQIHVEEMTGRRARR